MNRPAEGGGSGDYSSITPEVMNDLVANVKGAGSTLQTLVSGYQTRASGLGVSSPAFAKLLEMASWATDQVPMLQRRLTLAEAMEPVGATGYDHVVLSEPIAMTSSEAGAKGEELAQKILDHNHTDQGYVDLADDTLDELRNVYGNDPEVLSAFYAKLGPVGSQTMLSMYEASGGTDPDYVQKVSETFGTAFKDTDPPSEFQAIRKAFTTDNQGENSVDPMSWERLAMLQYGDFPSDFVRDVVNANGLDKMNDTDNNLDWRGDMTPPFGMPSDNRALIFGALKNNPEATRWALDGKDLDKITKDVYGAADFDYDLGQNFIAAINGGAGVGTEKMGEHSAEANELAGRFIYASAHVKDVPTSVQEGLGKLAASYAPELLTGSEGQDAASRSSSFDKPRGFTDIPGIDPGFYLSPKDTYRFLHGFGSDDKYSAPFDEAVGGLYHSTQVAAAKEMAENGDSDLWRVVNTRFGQLSGLQLQGQLDVRGDMDDADKRTRELIGNVISFGLGKIPTPQGIAAKYAWKLASYGAGKAISKFTDGDPEQTRVALRDDAEVQAAFMRQYQMASVLKDADYPGIATLPANLQDENGNLKDPSEIAKDADLIKSFQNWSDLHDNGKTNGIDAMVDGGQGGFEAGQGVAENGIKGNPDVDGDAYGW